MGIEINGCDLTCMPDIDIFKENDIIDGLEVVNIDIEEGLVGLLANTLLNEYHKPCIVFTKSIENPDVLKGSARAMPGFDLVKSFAYLSDITLTAGGHASAGGISIKKNDFNLFKDKFDEYCKNNPLEEYVEPYIDLLLGDSASS